MDSDKYWFWAMALVAIIVIAVCVSRHYETFEASLTAGPIKLDLRTGNAATTTLVNMPFAVESLAEKV